MPAHRKRCVACGCPKVCCKKGFIFFWVVFFILLQGGPISLLVLDLLSIKTEGTTISKYITEFTMETGVCMIDGNIHNSAIKLCDGKRSEFECMQINVNIIASEKIGSVSNGTFLWKSEREYVLDAYAPKCFNLDICTVDPDKAWDDYQDELLGLQKVLKEKGRQQEGFVCYYDTGKSPPIAILEMNTSLLDLCIWFILPLAGILLCWLVIFIMLCWYCCPRDNKQRKQYHEISAHEVNVEHDPNALTEALSPYEDTGNLQAGKWPTSGPAAACDM